MRAVTAVLTFAIVLRTDAPPLAPGHRLEMRVPTPPAAETLQSNDNRQPAGTRRDGRLELRLEARAGRWFPEGADGRGLDVAGFAEEGKGLQNPGPLIRVTAGTEVRVSLRNRLTRGLTVFGLGARGAADSVTVAADSLREIAFTPTAPGVYYYFARSKLHPFGTRREEDSQLNGAIIVDSPGAPQFSYGDRVFLMSWWFTFDSTSPTGLGRATMAINGLSWPHTERLQMTQGDSARWHVINLTESDHPMHLHGFYFRVEGKGNGIRDSVYSPSEQRMGVTEIVNPFETATLAWEASRPGNWIFHCHFAAHLALTPLDMERGVLDQSSVEHHMSDRPHQMYGLVLGISVAPHGEIARLAPPRRNIRLIVRERPHIYGDRPGYAFVLGGTREAADSTAMPMPGPPLVLKQGERVAITIVNQSQDRAAVHWHGIELESYADGVPGWSGHDASILPSVAPGDSITVRFTPPRAGTFMYHSHFNENQQINSGLYGPIIVLAPGQKFDPKVDRVMFVSSAGPPGNVITGPWPALQLNGKQVPDTMSLRAGVTYRFRFIDLTTDMATRVRLAEGDAPVEWRPVAKDGAALPAAQSVAKPALLYFDPGEIYDFEFMRKSPGDLTLRVSPPDAPPQFGFPKPLNVAVRVR
jgi:FtsP/CotA-like multicopper oxidase with cupredoxin domain